MIERKDVQECDVLVVGGGTAGMMAAISAADAGASVIIAEKANTKRSGAGATGNDHFQCYIPEVHGTLDEFMRLYMHDRPGPAACKDMDLVRAFVSESFDMVKLWESWGIPMRPHGYWEFTGHTFPWITGTHLKYAGVNQKPVFTKEALKRGVKILNHHPLSELITNDKGEVCGAVLVDLTVDPPRLQVIRAKSVILCTARASRLTGDNRIGWASFSPNDGVGTSAAYKAGALISNAGVTGFESGPTIAVSRYFNTGGTRTWVGTYTDIHGTPYAPFESTTTYDVLNPGTPGEPHEITWPTWKTGDYTQYLPENTMKGAYAQGKPVFMNFSYNTEEDTQYMEWALVHEGCSAILQHLKDENFDFKRKMLEFATARNSGGGKAGGPDIINARQETTVAGLYAAGECIGNNLPGLSPAAVGGYIAGRNAAAYSRTKEFFPAEKSAVVDTCAERFSTYLSNELSTASPTWEEVNIAIIQVMWDYCSSGILSDELFDVGWSHLKRIEEKMKNMQAGTPHDLMECMAVESVAQNAEIAMTAGRARKESRGSYKYAGYPEPNRDYDGKYFTVQKINGQPVAGLRLYRTEG